MARTVRDSKLDSPAARSRLKASGKPYFRILDTGLHLGYRKGRTGGRWVARLYLGDERYAVETIGVADDNQTADGAEILTFSQAQQRAREFAAGQRAPAPAAAPLTVGAALDAYLERLDAEHSKSLGDATNRAKNHIRPVLGARLVSDLTRDEIARWLKALADRPRTVRGKAGAEARALAAPKTAEERRQRKSSANRTLTVLRAALNQAFRDGLAASDVAWRAVKPFRETDAARIRYFTADELRRLVAAASPEFRPLLNAALFTGCRYGELGRLRVADFNPDAGTVYVAQSKSGKARHVVLTAEGQAFFGRLAAGRAGDALMLSRADGQEWGPSHQIRFMAETCKAARVAPAGFHTLRHTAASHNVMGGVPLLVVARNLGHSDTRMVEKHYAHLAPNYVAESIRKFAPTFGTLEEDGRAPLERTG